MMEGGKLSPFHPSDIPGQPGRRLKRMLVSSAALLSLLEVGSLLQYAVVEGVPEGAVLWGVEYSILDHTIYLLLESDEFPDVQPGAVIPFLDVKVRSLEEDERDRASFPGPVRKRGQG